MNCSVCVAWLHRLASGSGWLRNASTSASQVVISSSAQLRSLHRKFRSSSGFSSTLLLIHVDYTASCLPCFCSSLPAGQTCWLATPNVLFADVLFAQISFAHILSSRANWSYYWLMRTAAHLTVIALYAMLNYDHCDVSGVNTWGGGSGSTFP